MSINAQSKRFSGQPEATVEQILRTHLLTIATRASEGAAYNPWSNSFARSEVKEAWTNQTRRPLRTLMLAELRSLPTEVLDRFGFVRFNENLRLIPLWAFNLIADGETLTCITGKESVKGSDKIDLDVRAGAIAHGFRRELEG